MPIGSPISGGILGTGANIITLVQNTWYFDFINGNDHNSGLTPETALKSWTTDENGNVGGYLSKTGSNPLIDQLVTYTIMNDLPDYDCVTILGIPGVNCQIVINGVPTVVHSGVLGNITTANRPENIREQLFDADPTFDWTPYQGMLVQVMAQNTITYEGVVSSGPTYGWIALAELSPNLADMSVMCTPTFDPPNVFQQVWPGPFNIGDTYNILQLPLVQSVVIAYELQTNVTSFFTPSMINFISFEQPISTIYLGAFMMTNCSFDFCYSLAGFYGNCNFGEGIDVSVGGAETNFGVTGCGGIGSFNIAIAPAVWTAYGFMIQGDPNGVNSSQLYADGTSGSGNNLTYQNHHESFGLGIYNCDTACIFGGDSVFSSESNVYGQNNTTCIFDFEQGGYYVDSDVAIPGFRPTAECSGTSDFIINSHTSLPVLDPTLYTYGSPILLSWANLLASFADGGFGGYCFDPQSPMTRMEFRS